MLLVLHLEWYYRDTCRSHELIMVFHSASSATATGTLIVGLAVEY